MHKVCRIRDPELRTGADGARLWAGYVRDLHALMDAAVGARELDRAPAEAPRARAA